MSETSLAIMSRASKMLAEATTIQKAKELKDLALTAADWARRKGMGEEAIQHCRRYAVLAEVRLGEMLAATERRSAKHSKGGGSKGARRRPLPDVPPTLKELGVSKRESAEAQVLAALPKPVQAKVAEGEVTVRAAVKEVRRAKRAKAKATVPADLPAVTERYCVITGEFQRSIVDDAAAEWIITDPPYGKEYLPLYGDLSKFAARVLKPGGSLLAMVGQSYLPEILQLLSRHLRYHWTLAYHTPGGQAVQLWDRKVNTFWKPVLWFVRDRYAGDWIGDVCSSAVNDNDKRFHDWGQSESGMADIIERFTYPGQTICDPFCGGGTTGVVAVRMNRLFIGVDSDQEAVASTLRRLGEVASVK